MIQPVLHENTCQGDSGGKQELDEVAENLRHWKEHCSALGYDSDGEAMSVVTPTLEEGLDEGEVAARELRAREVRHSASRKYQQICLEYGAIHRKETAIPLAKMCNTRAINVLEGDRTSKIMNETTCPGHSLSYRDQVIRSPYMYAGSSASVYNPPSTT